MNRLVRRVAVAVVSPALAVALVQASVDARSNSQTGQQHTAAPAKVCFQNPVWGDSPCLL